jgi:hypothetical protein
MGTQSGSDAQPTCQETGSQVGFTARLYALSKNTAFNGHGFL